MFCRECGEKYLNDKAVICVKCGVEKGKGRGYCPECGNSVPNPKSEVCLSCGVSLKRERKMQVAQTNTNPKSKVAAALLAFFLGGLGIHRFYLGYTGIGLAQLLCTLILGIITLGFYCIIGSMWAFIEFILILTGTIKDVNGQPLL
ncbi:NINE protein [Clostridium sp.]|uniref:TM2 domain-containing protein n=1 Tax=Clostridium sp. TaxID=1506 RepID=UPI0028409B65|nr:NINE protein [Clostridium sp.]MDR3593568.1 NINE protein [Clostridium sp.]